MKTLKILVIIFSIVLFPTAAQAKFYYNFGLNFGLGFLGLGNVDPSYAVAVVPYAPVVATPVYTPAPCSYVSYYDYGNCSWWPSVSISFNSCGGYYGGYYGDYYGGYGYNSCYSSCYSPCNLNFGLGWGNCYPSWGNYYGYYGRRYNGYCGYGYDCNNYYINNYYYDNYPATAQRPTTVRENSIPYQNQRESRNILQNSLADNRKHTRTEGRNSSSRSLRSEIFASRNSVPNYRSSRERVTKNSLTRISRNYQRSSRSPSQVSRAALRTQKQPSRSRVSTTRLGYSSRSRTSRQYNTRTQPARISPRISSPRISRPSSSRISTPRVSRPSYSRPSSPRISRPSAPRMSAPRLSVSRAPSMSMPMSSGGRIRR